MATVWYYWTSGSTATSSATTTYDPAWSTWNDQGTSTAINSGNTTWVRWVTATTNTYVYTPPQETPMPVYPREDPEVTERYRQLAEKKKAAEAKAMELILDLLGPEQTEIYKRTGNLFVKGQECDWLISSGGKVSKIQKGKVVSLCVHSAHRHAQPESDNVIALALHAKFAEKELLSRANVIREVLQEKLPEAACF